MLIEALSRHHQTLCEADVDDLLETFLDYYEANIANRSLAYEGVAEALDVLQQRGAILAVCTNKREALSLQLLEALGLLHRFKAIAGRDTFPVFKPDPEHLFGAIRLAGGNHQRAVLIGDSATDVATAKAAQIPVVAVTFGYTDIPARDLGADRVVDSHTELIVAIENLL